MCWNWLIDMINELKQINPRKGSEKCKFLDEEKGKRLQLRE